MAEYALEVTNLHKSFKLPTEKAGSLKTAAVNLTKGIRGYKKQKVLRGISFKVKKGEFFGIVGRNGSGKSTLLKIISQIYRPTKGSVVVNGKLVPFIELGVGFNPELTGRENVYLNGALLGFSNKEIDDIYDEIVDFAELEAFMGQKLKNYSSGMQVRLAFSLAIRSSADILVLDEILAVGDEAFQRKCYAYFAEAKRLKKTVILVTHSMNIVQQFCTRALLISDGKILLEDNPAKVAQKYREMNNQDEFIDEKQEENKYIKVNASHKMTKDKRTFALDIVPLQDMEPSIISVFIDRDTGEEVYRFSTDEKIGKTITPRAGKRIKINLELQDIFPVGIFSVRVSVKTPDRSVEYVNMGEVAQFEVKIRGDQSQWDIRWHPEETFNVTEEG